MISGAPVYTLAECLKVKPGDPRDDEDGGSAIESEIERAKEQFRKTLYVLNDEHLAFLRRAVSLTQSRAEWSEDVTYYPFSAFFGLNSAFLFDDGGALKLVVPIELLEIYEAVIGEADYEKRRARNNEIALYADGLIELYGVYDFDWFAEVWNQHHKDKIDCKDAENMLLEFAQFHANYYFIDDFVVHDCLLEDEFEELYELVEDMDYYMPTKSVIRKLAFSGYTYDNYTPNEKAMNAFLAGYIHDARKLDVVWMGVILFCNRLYNEEEIKEDLLFAGAPANDDAFVGEFERLYNKLREDRHIWDLRGFTTFQYSQETGKTVPRFKLPREKKTKRGRTSSR
jgi:hypothetical protein